MIGIKGIEMATKSSKSSKSTKPALAAVPKDDAAEAIVTAPAKPPQIAIVADSDENSGGASKGAAKGDGLKMKELLTAVTTKTGAKKKDAKDVVDATLAEIAAALKSGKSLNLPPLGNLRVAKTQEKGGATMMVLKLRMGGGGAKEALADDADDS